MDTTGKILQLDEVIPIVERLKTEGKTIVVTNGCFDLIHPGHVAGFEWAKSQGDVLIVAVNSDSSVKENKGDKRPVATETARARVVAGFAAVDYVFLFNEKDTLTWVPKLRAHIVVKGEGSQTHPDFAAQEEAVRAMGGEMRFAPTVPGYSTSNLIQKILER